ncbi:MAG: hypothetical protein AAF685_15480 [Cyanobacteria bacterium P01_C01_bin.89]
MSQTDLLVLARQGNVEAIATLMNRKLTSVQVAVEAQLEGDCLLLQLVAHGGLPSQGTLVTFVRRGMDILKVRQVDSVQVSAWRAGAMEPLWVEWLELGEDGYVEGGRQRSMAETANLSSQSPFRSSSQTAPQGQAFGVNLAALAAAASNGKDAGGTATNVPQLPVFNGEATEVPGGLPSSPWDADPESDYRAWMLEQNLGWQYRWQVPRLAAFLVYFLNSAETLLDMVGVIYQRRRCVVLLTNQRLFCLGMSLRQQGVREFFSVPLAAFGSGEAQAAIAPAGVSISYPLHGLNAAVRWSKVEQGREFLRRSFQRVVPVDFGAMGSRNGDGNRDGGNNNSRGEDGNAELSSELSSGLALWDGGFPGDRLSLWFYGLLIIITAVVLILLFVAAP